MLYRRVFTKQGFWRLQGALPRVNFDIIFMVISTSFGDNKKKFDVEIETGLRINSG